MINMSIMGNLMLLGIWAIRRGLWTYVKVYGKGQRIQRKGGGSWWVREKLVWENGASDWRDRPAKEICVPMTRGDHKS